MNTERVLVQQKEALKARERTPSTTTRESRVLSSLIRTLQVVDVKTILLSQHFKLLFEFFLLSLRELTGNLHRHFGATQSPTDASGYFRHVLPSQKKMTGALLTGPYISPLAAREEYMSAT